MVVPGGVVRSANLSNEGQYTCNLYSPAHNTRIEMTVMLHVIREYLHVLFPDQHTPRINSLMHLHVLLLSAHNSYMILDN